MKAESFHYKKFKLYHQQYPHVWETFCTFADQAKAAGLENWGVGCVFELMRWHTDVTKTIKPTEVRNRSGELIKVRLSNSLRAYYARLYNTAFDCSLFKTKQLDEPEPEYITEILLPTQPGHPYYWDTTKE